MSSEPAILEAPPSRTAPPTIWGLHPLQVHDRFWASVGVQVVRRGERSEIVAGAELFLLAEEGTLVLFDVRDVIEPMYWLGPDVLLLRVRDAEPGAYRERVVSEGDSLVRFEREYRGTRGHSVRVALTSDPEIASRWQATASSRPWARLRAGVGVGRCASRAIRARVFDAADDVQVMECLREMLRRWRRPDVSVPRARPSRGSCWSDPSSRIDDRSRVLGPVWVGAGRSVGADDTVVGPAVLWDDPRHRPAPEAVEWLEIEPAPISTPDDRPIEVHRVPGKRLFDIVFATFALLLTAPLYPVVALLILLEDGRPIFFAHRRETVGGREFGCFKFRSMRKDADALKAELARANHADGPQFYVQGDPRVTRVGRWLRRFQIDELPQFVNVLLGDMSVVGPRPSPYRENQFCPAWREARLSVRPGVTGLWQVRRTRRRGLDFQEWIRFDLDYVRNASWRLDLAILWRTVGVVLGVRG